MANTIKQKRGTTDPGASDLVVGELAINTTDGGVFTKTDGGTVVEIGPGGSPSFSSLTVTGQTTLAEIKEATSTLTGTDLDPDAGSVQIKTLSANTTFTESLEDGQSLVLHLINGASYTVTWPTITWVTSAGNTAPTLTANDVLVFWQLSTTLYGAYVGSAA